MGYWRNIGPPILEQELLVGVAGLVAPQSKNSGPPVCYG